MAGLDEKLQSQMLELFAEVFQYPSERLPDTAERCAGLIAGISAEAAKDLREVGRFARVMGVERMEEVYTRTFDVTPTTTLYVGYHLFGDSYKRGAFLVALLEKYRERGFSAGGELVDHLAPILRFASAADDPEFAQPLLFEAVVPALAKMEVAFQGSDNAYRLAARALKACLALTGADYLATLAERTAQEGNNAGSVLSGNEESGSSLTTPHIRLDAGVRDQDETGCHCAHKEGVRV